ncbi:hypothetical protein K439DRAFT_1610331 [Ramaria rubella]|nr:hypothetical protein K439DRAFT_1610331 [Ramaria rubella]
MPKNRIQPDLLLHEYRLDHPMIFRSFVCVTPATFDALVLKLQDDLVFHNKSNPQMPVNKQIVVTLFCFGHFGNAASAQKWPDDEAKERAKAWVEEQSCLMWRDGWLMVDGMLVPLYTRPGFFGNSFFDRKSNYSMSVQLISTPDLCIVDYGVGMPGSQHDSTAWLQTCIPQEHETLLSSVEWVWADTAYPLQTWCQAPYKKIHIRSEHCVGYLKGCWSSLRGLQLKINKPKGVHFTSLWITCCITLHNLAIQIEAGMDGEADEFYHRGIALVQAEHIHRETEQVPVDVTWENETERQREVACDVALLEARLRWEELKKSLFSYLE